MGVSGLTPFLQKICPNVLKTLPNRLQTLRGKKIVIDGTLITQRFHFTPEPHLYRHVLGWYRLAQELDDNGVQAICVFDGKQRSAAKAQENQRRRAVRRLTVARGSLEQDRFQRLRKLKDGVECFQNLDLSQQHEVIKALDIETDAKDTCATLLQEDIVPTGEKPEEICPPTPDEVPPLTPEETPQPTPEEDRPARTDETSQILPSDPGDLVTLFTSLHLSYKANVAKLSSLTVDSTSTQAQKLPPSVTDDEATEYVMTKAQHQLTVEENNLWKQLSTSLASPPPVLSGLVEEELGALVDRSQTMQTSFQRRTNFPNSDTYRESKEILTAMGIPCIDATGAVEGEALASSMVLGGLADYVASEDTDVLVYDAPLIKNISSRSDPLVVVSGADVRTSLELDRAAFVDFALLLGTDFSQRIKNLGPTNAYHFIRKHGTIEQILEAIETQPRYTLKISRDVYLAQVQIAREVFGTLPPVPPSSALEAGVKSDKDITEIMQRYGLGFAHSENWDYTAAYDSLLGGNPFEDDPRA